MCGTLSISAEHPLLLASGSPRRTELLTGLGLPHRVRPSNAEETLEPGATPESFLRQVVRDKLTAAGEAGMDGCAAILVADTIVVVDGTVIGKPRDRAHAFELLRCLAGRAHVVFTRYALSVPASPKTPLRERTVSSRVTLRSATDAELSRYAATGEGLDKAGAYAAQGIGAFLVAKLDGSYANVVGLPVCELVSDLTELGLLLEFPWPSGVPG